MRSALGAVSDEHDLAGLRVNCEEARNWQVQPPSELALETAKKLAPGGLTGAAAVRVEATLSPPRDLSAAGRRGNWDYWASARSCPILVPVWGPAQCQFPAPSQLLPASVPVLWLPSVPVW